MSKRPSVPRAARGFRVTVPIVLATLAAVMVLAAGGLYVMDSGSAPADTGVQRAAAPPGLPYPEVLRVSVEEAKALLDAKGAIFLDVRSPVEYRLGHIPGAVPMPLRDMETRVTDLRRGAAIITYCT